MWLYLINLYILVLIVQKLQYFTSCLHSHNYKIGAKLQKIFELSAHFAPKNIKKHTFLSRFYKKDHSISSKKGKRRYIHFSLITPSTNFSKSC